jgi:hypothetical protein
MPIGADKYEAGDYVFDGNTGEVRSRTGLIFRPGTIAYRDLVYDLWTGYYAKTSFPLRLFPGGLTYDEKMNTAFKTAYDKASVAETARPTQLLADGNEQEVVSPGEQAALDAARAKGEVPPPPDGSETSAPKKEADPDKKPITEQPWFYPSLAGGIIVLGAGAIWFTRKKT